mmetsp:Transcript_30688/g.101588  ORF Transcript_30688/g.101588 Transcript_30688/m.101588 type:complete len:254 (+) Transcript_30688:664-1425(+)
MTSTRQPAAAQSRSASARSALAWSCERSSRRRLSANSSQALAISKREARRPEAPSPPSSGARASRSERSQPSRRPIDRRISGGGLPARRAAWSSSCSRVSSLLRPASICSMHGPESVPAPRGARRLGGEALGSGQGHTAGAPFVAALTRRGDGSGHLVTASSAHTSAPALRGWLALDRLERRPLGEEKGKNQSPQPLASAAGGSPRSMRRAESSPPFSSFSRFRAERESFMSCEAVSPPEDGEEASSAASALS